MTGPLSRLSLRSRLVDANVYYGWIVAWGCFVASLVVFGMTYSFGIFVDAMMVSFEASRGRISLVYGVHTFVLFVSAGLVGGLVDAIGPRRMLTVGGVLLGAGLVGASRSESLLALFLSYGVVAAVGLSVVYVVAYATVPKWFSRRRGLANGVATAGLGVGLLTVTPVASSLIDAFGWRTAYLVLAAGLVAVLGLVALVFAGDPADVGADPAHEFPEGRPESDVLGASARIRRATSVVRRPAFLLVLLGWVCVYATLYVVMGHLVLYVTDVGMARWVGVWAVAALGVSTSGARIGLGFVSDRVGRVRLFVTCSALMGLTLLLLPLAVAPLAVFGFAVVYGVGYGGNGALLSPLVADMFGTTDLNTLFGVMSLAFAVSGLLAPPIAGTIHDAVGTYVPVFVGVGLLGLVGAALVAAAGRLTDEL